jgi:hypothetical protein
MLAKVSVRGLMDLWYSQGLAELDQVVVIQKSRSDGYRCHDPFTYDLFTLPGMCLPGNKPDVKEQAEIPPISHFAEVSLVESSLIFAETQCLEVLPTSRVRSLRQRIQNSMTCLGT